MSEHFGEFQRDKKKPRKANSGKRVSSDGDFKSFLNLQYSRCVVPLEAPGTSVGLQTKL